ncbi:MAG: hypothetical protein HN348_28215, partial [Proteobacteria bacterium]|nr:hypothetical protein [Pseudomonadota bacterium]
MKPLGARLTKHHLISIILTSLIAALAWRNIVDLDFGIHLASGRWIVHNGWVPQTDPFTYTVASHEYVAYHWLFQVVLYLINRWFGAFGLVLFRWTILLGGFALVADILRRRKVTATSASLCGLAAILAAEWRFTMRPELLSFLFLATTLWVLERWRLERTAPLWLLPLSQLFWINTHIYLFGWALMLAYLADDCLHRRSWRTPLVKWMAVAAVVLIVNPYHYRAIIYPLVLVTRMDSANIFAQHISELASPFALDSDPRFPFSLPLQLSAYKLLLGLSVIAVVLQLRQRRWLDPLILVVFGTLSALAMRNLLLFAVVCVPAVCTALDDWGQQRFKTTALLPRAIFLVTTAFAAMNIPRVLNGSYYSTDRREGRFSAEVCRSCLSLDAADWLARQNLTGHGFNNLNLGGTLLWRDSQHKVFIDGRNEVTGERFFKAYLQASNPERWDETQRIHQFEYVVLAHRSAMHLARLLYSRPDWKMAYLDASAIVFVRADGPNGHLATAALPTPVDLDTRWRILHDVHTGAGWRETLARWLWTGQAPPQDEYHLGTFLLTLGEWPNSEAALLAAIEKSPGFYEISNNLGALYYRAREWEAALLCYQNVL